MHVDSAHLVQVLNFEPLIGLVGIAVPLPSCADTYCVRHRPRVSTPTHHSGAAGRFGGRFDPVVVNIRKPLSPVQLRVQDVNGDRYPDLVYLAGSNVFVRENASARDFKPESKFLDSASGWSAFDVVPLDASETLPDLILANGSTKQLSYSLNQSK